MKPNTCLVIDVWEGQLEIDEAVLKANGVAGIGIRLNDMNGGHHMDTGFAKQWAEAANFVRFPYFVYNPWVNGQANFDWLAAHMPADVKRVALDIEVRYSGYSPSTYAAEVYRFVNLCRTRWHVIIYTAQWFLPYLSTWPKDVEYWWAQYISPTAYLTNVKTWDDLKLVMDKLDKPFNASAIPGPLRMWQFSADYLVLPGTLRDIDVNVFYGTEAELAAYFGAGEVTPPVVPSGAGLYRILDDLELRALKRPIVDRAEFVRNGLPSTVRMRGGSGFVLLPSIWMQYVYAIQGNTNYQFLDPKTLKPAVGWHNTGAANRVEQVVFSGNIVEVTSVVDNRAYIKTVSSADVPPARLIKPVETSLHPLIHLLTTQFATWLDMSTDGRWPRVLPISNPGERLYIDIANLIYCRQVQVLVTATPYVNMRATPGGAIVGRKLPGEVITVIRTVTYNGLLWGLIYGGWIALKYTTY